MRMKRVERRGVLRVVRLQTWGTREVCLASLLFKTVFALVMMVVLELFSEDPDILEDLM